VRTRTSTGSAHMPLVTRRQCIGGLAAAWLGAATLPASAAEPKRVACLEWAPVEMVLSLGIEPVAVADNKGYRDWVAEPILPPDAIDLGSRGEPNLELLREIRPDLVVGADGSGFDPALFEQIAPVYTVPFNDGSETAYAHAERETRKLGRVLDREAEAELLIARTASSIADARTRLADEVRGPLAVVSMFDDRHVRVYGKGSLLQDVLDRLGLINAWTGETNSWGFATMGIEELVVIGQARLISLDPIPPHIRIRIDRSSLWANLPCVRAGRVTAIPAVWPFGGLAAASRFADLLARAA
jgi:ABC-type Fe3+-hydroxamate transport system substrate-binding protein